MNVAPKLSDVFYFDEKHQTTTLSPTNFVSDKMAVEN